MAAVVHQTLRLAWRADRRSFRAAALVSIFDVLVPIFFVEITRRVVHAATEGATSGTSFVLLIALLALTMSVTRTSSILRANWVQLLGAKTGSLASSMFLEKVIELGPARLDEPELRDRMERAATEVTTKPNRMVSSSLSGLVSVAILASLVGKLATIQPLVAVLAVLSVVPVTIAQRRANRFNYDYRRSVTVDLRRAAYIARLLTDRTSGVEIYVSGAGPKFVDRYRSLSEKNNRGQQEALARGNRGHLIAGLAGGLVLGGGFIVATSGSSVGALSAGDVAAFIVSINLLSLYFSLLVNSATSLQGDALFIREFFDFLDLESSGARGESRRTPQICHTSPCQTHPTLSLRFRDVSFRYPSRGANALSGVSLELFPGQMLALVGANGAGKSTIVRLLVRLYDPDSGVIELGGVNTREMGPDEVRRRVAVLFQEPTRLELSVRDAIQAGQWEKDVHTVGSDARVWRALERAGADDIVRGFPGGLDAQLGLLFPGGVELSGGEWQRLALARAYYREADVVVLDEPTAALDPMAELRVFDDVRRHLDGAIGIVISHRFATVRSADVIMVIEDGRVLEAGSHDQLIFQGGRYAELFEVQAVGYR